MKISLLSFTTSIPKKISKPLCFIILILLNSSCKEPKLTEEKNDELFSSNCRVSRFTEFERNYSFEYDSQGLPTKIYLTNGGEGLLYQTLGYKNRSISTIHRIGWNGSSHPESNFEYDNEGRLNLIRKFDSVRRNFSDTTVYTKEIERIEFKYESQHRPSSLTRWLVDQQGQFFKSHESVFEYDNEGNLVIEKMHVFPGLYASEADYLYEYFYDENPNSQRQLNYLFFSANDSPPKLFSTNNLNRIRLSYDNKLIKDGPFKLVYDSDGNIINDGYRYSGIKWVCE